MKRWTRFVPSKDVVGPDGERTLPDGVIMWTNSRFAVTLTELPKGVTWLSFKNRDRTARHDWRDMQRMKNELCGDEREAFEIYPAESRLHDSANQFHLWVLPKGETIPFGFDERVVSQVAPGGTGSQRRFEKRPQDLLNAKESAALSPLVKWFNPDKEE